MPFGLTEPAFGNDVGFYVFTLPLLEELRDLFLMLIVLSGRGAGDRRFTGRAARSTSASRRRAFPRPQPAHLSVLLGLFFIQRALNYWLGRFDLLLHTNGVVFGLRYVDRRSVAAGSVAAGGAVARRGRDLLRQPARARPRLPVAAAVIVFGPGAGSESRCSR